MSFFVLRMLVSVTTLVLCGVLVGRALRRTFPEAWRRWVKRAFHVGVVALTLATAGWAVGRLADVRALSTVSTFVGSAFFVTAFLLLVSLPLWAGVPAVARWFPRRGEPDPGRRAFLSRAIGVVPVATAATGPIGTAASMMAPALRRAFVHVSDLPAGLDGLRILQLSDVHLGTFIDVDQVTRAVELARAERPELVVLTGDVADDYDKLRPALDACASLAPPLGAFAIYGNHEVYQGRASCKAIYDESAVRLLCEEGVVLERNGARFFLGGCDDPATLGREHRAFLNETVRRTMAACPDDVGLRVLLSHRPEGFEEAARLGVTLTLAGHTHGAQASFFGRSWLEPVLPESYLLGHYRRGESHLYTTAGLGHWFPFRFNCPCEVVLVTLRRGSGSARVG